MTKEEYLDLAASRWDALESLQDERTFYDYEKKFDTLWVELGRQVLEKTVGVSSTDRRIKKKSKVATE
ncbi:hypothetical protein [Tunicatimonas pelagia]|uniref:hypothetical protein n=1 Tax=Tunicatimonas pelagia TaxID=931531 RepID=UPI0026650B3B|nr:hypothetical protein [Tunicatimonas pelagia]WKN41561.1 hypothetical protein P0M28_21230 [Tunicatimonas pelagia]WKN43300.1 hypothetical protein P0M28_30105 [Tunicatimonas pelagia]WKN45708.1 hypothetical protein P0M28_12145 [Tunicatimonas pelagia]